MRIPLIKACFVGCQCCCCFTSVITYQLFVIIPELSVKIRNSCQDCANTQMILGPCTSELMSPSAAGLGICSYETLEVFVFSTTPLNSRALLEQSWVPKLQLVQPHTSSPSKVMETAVLFGACQKHSRRGPGTAVSYATECSVCRAMCLDMLCCCILCAARAGNQQPDCVHCLVSQTAPRLFASQPPPGLCCGERKGKMMLLHRR